MGCRVANITFDAADPLSQVRWWARVLDDFAIVPDGSMTADDAELRGPGGRWLEFLRVPDAKIVKNRVHLCLRPSGDTDRDAEVTRILALGATMVDDRRAAADGGWAVLADPEGNEFCVLNRSAQSCGIDAD